MYRKISEKEEASRVAILTSLLNVLLPSSACLITVICTYITFKGALLCKKLPTLYIAVSPMARWDILAYVVLGAEEGVR